MANGDKSEIHLHVIKLCAVQGCCPEVEFKDDGNVEIRVDFGGRVTLNAEQFAALKEVGTKVE